MSPNMPTLGAVSFHSQHPGRASGQFVNRPSATNSALHSSNGSCSLDGVMPIAVWSSSESAPVEQAGSVASAMKIASAQVTRCM